MFKKTTDSTLLTNLDDPRMAIWLEQAHDLAHQFSAAVHEESPCAQSLDLAIIHLAALHVWQSNPGRPQWARLDVDRWIAAVAARTDGLELYGVAAVTVQAFFCFLLDTDRVSETDAQPILKALVPYTAAAWTSA